MSKMITCAVVWVADPEAAESVGEELRAALARMGFDAGDFEIMVGPATTAPHEGAVASRAAPGGRVFAA